MPHKRTRPAAKADERRARRLDRSDRRHLIHGFISPSAIDRDGTILLVKARGPYVWDSHGNRYLDGLSSLWNVTLGHGEPAIARRVAKQIRTLSFAPTLLGFSSQPAVELAERLTKLAPKGLGRVVFTSGGSESNETVIRLARAYWRLRGHSNKFKFVALERAYHGTSMGAASLTGLTTFHQYYEPLLPGVVRIPNAYCYRCPLGKTYPSCKVACADELERAIEREGADTIAAFIAEPVQGVGGVIVPPPEYFERIRRICDRHGILFVVDEVITGFGRLGYPFGIQRWGVAPDMLVFAKGVTSGYVPLGGVLVSDKVFETFLAAGDDFALHHGYTYSGHPVACAAALANLDELSERGLLTRARRLTRELERRLRPLRDLPIVGDIRIAGMMAAVELVRDRPSKQPFAATDKIPWRIREAARARGVIVRGSGDCIVVCPPLTVESRHLDELCTALREAIEEVAGTIC